MNKMEENDMKNNNTKSKRIMIVSVLLFLCVFVVGGIYLTTTQKHATNHSNTETNNDETPIVEEINTEKLVTENTEEPVIEIEEIIEEVEIQENPKEAEVVIEETLPEEPQKPDNTPPTVIPETKDDVEDMTTEPEYEEKEVTYVEEEEEVPVNETEPEPDEESNLVPDSENPFANPENAATPTEVNGEDYYEDGRKPGEGDKF